MNALRESWLRFSLCSVMHSVPTFHYFMYPIINHTHIQEWLITIEFVRELGRSYTHTYHMLDSQVHGHGFI